MLGVEYQSIYCKVKKCQHNHKHVVYDSTDKVAEVYYTCEKEDIYLDKTGKCREA